jgi:hypothetical protein
VKLSASFAFLCILLASCGGGPSSRGTTTVPPVRRAADAPAADALVARVVELDAQLRRAGAMLDATTSRGFLAAGESATVEVSAPAGGCATVTTLASGGVRDLDATLFAPSGDALAEDVAEDAHPTVQLCAPGPEARRAFLVVRAYSGAGAYVVATFASPRAALPAIARVIGGAPGVASDTTSEVADDARLRDFALGASRRGFAPRGEPRVVPLAASQSVRVPLPVAAGECVTVLALAERGLEDVDAVLLDADGTELARDVGTGRDATLQRCADRTADLALVLTAVRGQGAARVAVFVGPVTRVGGASGLWLGQPAAERASTRSLDAGLADARSKALAEHFAVRGATARVALARGGAWRTTSRAEANTCLRFEATAGPGVARPYVLVSSNGAALAESEGRGEGAPAVAELCTTAATDLDVTLVARSGSGELGLTVSSRPSAAEVAEVAPPTARPDRARTRRSR